MATFFDALGQYATNRVNNMADRFNTATEYFTDPQEALRKRMEEEEEERKRREREQQLMAEMEQRQRDQEQANTPVKQTIVTNPDGTQEMTIKGTPQALSGMNPNTPTVTAPVAPSVAPGSPELTGSPDQDRERLIREAQERERVATQPITPVAPQPQPVVVQTPPQPETQAPRMMPAVFQPGTQPTPQPAVAQAPVQVTPVAPQPQVTPQPLRAVPTQAATPAPAAAPAAATPPITTPAPAAAPPAAPAVVDFSAELSNLVSDPAKLASYYGDTSKPEPARKIALDLFQAHLKGTYSQDKATKTLEAAAQGDRKAQNEVMRDLQREDGSYIKAILFARLGLNRLAEEEQNKLGNIGKTVSRAILGTSPYTIETDNRGAIVRAWDESGSRADEKTLAALNSSAVKQGAQAYGFTGGISTLPTTGEPLQARQNAITGQAEYIYMTGPNRGQIYTGKEIPVQQRVQTQAMVDYNRKLIDFATNPNIAAGTEALKFAIDAYGINSPEVQRTQAQINRVLGPQALNQIISAVPAPAGQAAPQAAPAPSATPSAVPQGGPAVPAPAGQAALQAAPAGQPAPQAAPSAAPAVGGTGGRVAGGAGGQPLPGESPAAFRKRMDIGTAAAKENIQVQGARAQSFNKILDEEVRPEAQKGDTIVSIRKQQFAMFDRPGIDANKLFGLYTAAQESPGDQKLSIIRDIFGGVFKPETEVSQRLAQLNLTPQEKAALVEYNIANQKINAATLKQTAGGGSVSDAEQKANRDANVDITKVPALGAYNAMAQSQFDGDRARYKADWALTQPAQNALELDRAWRKESQRLAKIYQETATARAKFIAQNGGTYSAVREGYRRFPIPEYDPESGSWKKTKPLAEILK